MIAKASAPAIPLRPELENLLTRHGTARVILALMRALLNPRRRKTRPPDVSRLSPHLRRDIGLPVETEAPRRWHLNA